MDGSRIQESKSTVLTFLVGVLIGGLGGGIAGWLLGGHLTPLLASVLNLITRDDKRRTVRFEALQQ
jgi:hypothetical protein